MSGLFVNPYTADNKYSPPKRLNLLQHFQIQLSQEGKTFYCIFLFAFPKFRFSFEHFQNKDDAHTLNTFFNLRTSKNVFRSTSKKVSLQRTL